MNAIMEKELQGQNALAALTTVTYAELIEAIASQVAEKVEAKQTREQAMAEYLTAGEVCKMLKIATKTLDNKINEGELPPPIMGGGTRGAKRLWLKSQFANLS